MVVVRSSKKVVTNFLLKSLCFRELSVSSRVVSNFLHLFSLYITIILLLFTILYNILTTLLLYYYTTYKSILYR